MDVGNFISAVFGFLIGIIVSIILLWDDIIKWRKLSRQEIDLIKEMLKSKGE